MKCLISIGYCGLDLTIRNKIDPTGPTSYVVKGADKLTRNESWSGSQLLADYEKLVQKDTNGSLQKTLQVYFAYNTDFALTAKNRYVHRNTLRYRLGKINDILDIDLKNLKDLFRLYMATHLSEWNKQPD